MICTLHIHSQLLLNKNHRPSFCCIQSKSCNQILEIMTMNEYYEEEKRKREMKGREKKKQKRKTIINHFSKMKNTCAIKFPTAPHLHRHRRLRCRLKIFTRTENSTENIFLYGSSELATVDCVCTPYCSVAIFRYRWNSYWIWICRAEMSYEDGGDSTKNCQRSLIFWLWHVNEIVNDIFSYAWQIFAMKFLFFHFTIDIECVRVLTFHRFSLSLFRFFFHFDSEWCCYCL